MALDYVKARELASYLLARLKPDTRRHAKATELLEMLEPPLTMPQILARIPAPTVTARARLLKISRQAYYNIQTGICLPAADTRERLSQLTGVSVEAIREAGHV